jgi:extracellular elastinolytic metalloproteinase
MIQEKDSRNLLGRANLESLDAEIDPLAIDFTETEEAANSWTGKSRALKIDIQSELEGDLVKRALNYLEAATAVVGFEGTTKAEFQADPNILETSTGKKVVHTQQMHRGIQVLLANTSVIFNESGQVEQAVGDTVSLPSNLSIEPKVSARGAVVVAADWLLKDEGKDEEEEEGAWGETKEPIKKFQEKFVAKKTIEFQKLTSKQTVFDKSIFYEDIRSELVIFYIGPEARLGWYFNFTINETGLQYDVVVSADDISNIEVLYCKKISVHALAKGNIYRKNGSEVKEWVNFPLDHTEYPLYHPSANTFNDWVAENETRGINVRSSLANTIECLQGVQNSSGLLFDPSTTDDEVVLNTFYFCNFMHDFFLLLGFDTNSGNFEGEDAVIAKSHNASIVGVATMSTPADGSSPIMNMGIFPGTGKHAALDADVVFHEYVHGVTNRLVGGRNNDRSLIEDQSAAMGEGWSDYFALSIQNFKSDQEKFVLGDWLNGKPTGIRSHPYNDDYNLHLTYGKLKQVGGVHKRGELWCATLLHWTRHLASVIGKKEAHCICWQAIVDGLKLTNANPSFLDARNAILNAVTTMIKTGKISADQADIVINKFKTSFARFGMGSNASTKGPWMHGIVENFDIA